MKKLLSLVLSLLALVLVGCSKSKSPAPGSSDQFEVGQIWQYHTRSNEPDSRAIIARIDNLDNIGTVIHVKLTDLKIKNTSAPGGFSTVLTHAPITETQLKKNVTQLVAQNGDLEDFQDGYDTWLKAYLSGKAGVFTISLAQIVDCIEEGIGSASPNHNSSPSSQKGVSKE
ncbi:MAG: hypothetical protein ACYSTF_02225 [Planctomycetota bacterium]|jgi:hypothetical protein